MKSTPATHNDEAAGSAPVSRPMPRGSKPFRASSSSASTATLVYEPSPFRPSSYAVPFSWEHRPGIPKTPGPRAARSTTLPLPPPLRFAPGAALKIRAPVGHDDPFAAALAKCAKGSSAETEIEIEKLFARSGMPVRAGRRASATGWSISARLGFFGILASCKGACTVDDSTAYITRAGLKRRPTCWLSDFRSDD